MGKKRKNIKLIIELKKEIDKLEQDIKNVSFTNKKIKLLKLYKIILKYLQLIAPYIITAAITFGIFSKLGLTPFFIDKTEKYLYRMEEFDTNGNIRYEDQYKDFSRKDQIIRYTKWEQIDENLYQREQEIYYFDKLDDEKIKKLINNNDIKSINDILEGPISKRKETKNNVTEKELSQGESIKAIIYSIDKDNIIIADEPLEVDTFTTIGWIALIIMLSLGINKFREDFSNFDIENEIDSINNKYPIVKKEELTKKLEVKKATYNRLRR